MILDGRNNADIQPNVFPAVAVEDLADAELPGRFLVDPRIQFVGRGRRIARHVSINISSLRLLSRGYAER